ncbi:MAG: cytochrome-c peroxidase [Gammaproteobacteria bacterium]
MKILMGTALFLALATNAYASQITLTAEQQLGKRLFNDKNLSLNRNQSCATCHSTKPAHAKRLQSRLVPGFVDPDNVKTGSPVSDGSVRGLSGTLNAPSVGYSGFSPAFHWDEGEGVYIGGQFWNGRASNLIEQAKMPFTNPVEMAMPDAASIVERIKQQSVYRRLFDEVYGIDLDAVATPASPTAEQVQQIEQVFEKVATAIGRFEQSPVFNKFNSKFDYVMTGQTEFTPQEARGFDIFNNKGQCAACHVSDASTDEAGHIIQPALFTDFTYDNIGLPLNVNIPGNPEPNLGLGGRQGLEAETGKHKVMSLRNIAITAPYGHNGSMSTLQQIVHFYNTRDTLGFVDNLNDPGYGISGWPSPEISENLNQTELGSLGLTTDEEADLVAFLETLTDDYPKWGRDPRVPWNSHSPYSPPYHAD